jgi:hypothetical protein
VVIEVDSSQAVRENSIKIIKGVPASTPANPILASDTNLHQYPLCYIYRPAGSNEITQAYITNMVGSEATPFVTGILQTISLDTLLGQWRNELDQFVSNEKSAFSLWFNSIKDQLSSDAAGNLQNQIDKISPRFVDIALPRNADDWSVGSSSWGLEFLYMTFDVPGSTTVNRKQIDYTVGNKEQQRAYIDFQKELGFDFSVPDKLTIATKNSMLPIDMLDMPLRIWIG